MNKSPGPPQSTPEIEVFVEVDEADAPPPAPEGGARASMVGSKISERYRVDELIAQGGMGAVYRGEHVHMRKLVAIKVLKPDAKGFPDLVQRFEREAIAGAHIDHPNVASATDFGRLPDGSFFLVLEYVEGTTLRDRMRAGPITPREAADLARQIAEALAACHRMHVVHRDVKPRDIMIEAATGRVKLIDFGLAKVPDHVSRASSGGASRPRVDPIEDEEDTKRSITLNGVVFGTVAYMAPEAEFGMNAVDHRADLYAVGIMLYEMLTGRHPFDAKELAELFFCQKNAVPPPFAVRAPDRKIPAELEAITMRLLAKRPGERYADADALLTALDQATASGVGQPAVDGAARKSGPGASASRADISAESTFEPVTSARASLLGPGAGLGGSAPRRARGRWLALAAAGVVALAVGATLRGPGGVAAPLERAAPAFAPAAAAAARAAKPDPARSSAATDAARTRLHAAAEARGWSAGGDAIVALADAAAGADLDARDVAPAANVALALAFAESPKATAVFDALANRLGAWGLDVLYDVSSKHGGARGAKRSDALLAEASVRARATPAVRAALALRDARCEDKASLFEATSRDGDERALILLERLRGVNCTASRCCYLKNRPLNDGITEMKARLGSR